MTNGWIDIKNADMMLAIAAAIPPRTIPAASSGPSEGQEDAQREADRSGSALYAHGGHIRFILPDSGRSRYCFPRRYGPLRDREQPHREGLSRQLHQRRFHREGRLLKLPRRRVVLRVRRCEQDLRQVHVWNYEDGNDAGGVVGPQMPRGRPPPQQSLQSAAIGQASAAPTPLPPLPAKVAYDLTLQNPRCVFQLLKQQYSRYTPEIVERITGVPKDQFLKAADLFTSVRKDGDMKKVATIMYAVGWTQHSFGTQIIRTAAILQLLLGNIGRAGGGVNALRGHSNIQGATDMGGIFDSLPGYLKVPNPTDT